MNGDGAPRGIGTAAGREPKADLTAAGIGRALSVNIATNFGRWLQTLAPPPPWRVLVPPIPMLAGAVATLAIVIFCMVFIDSAASDWARHQPQWFRNIFERITDFGLSGWFLFPCGFILLCLAAIITVTMPRLSQGVLLAVAARFGFVFLAVGVPGLFVAIVKRMIGRARPYAGGADDPLVFRPFIWRPQYSSLPSGHATTAVAAALAIGALWPRLRGVMWAYAVIIMASRIIVLAHHPSDVIAGALTGAAGVFVLRRWFASRRLLFCPGDLRRQPGPSLRRIIAALSDVRLTAVAKS